MAVQFRPHRSKTNMAWNKKTGICDRCGQTSKHLEPAFGKHICNECKTDRPKKGHGNAGLFADNQQMLTFENGLHLDRVKKSNGIFGHYFFSHYPKSKGIPGRSLCYLVYDNAELIGIIAANSPPANYKIFRTYFATDNDNCFVNNNIFRLIESKKNIASRVLKIFRWRVRQDYRDQYGETLQGIITFVEPPRTGICYQADNWDFLGMTQGKRMRRDKETWKKVFTEGTAKYIYGKRFKTTTQFF